MPTMYQYVVKDNDLFGTDLLREKSTKPVAFRPSITHVNRQSANKLNNNHTVESIVPVIRNVDGAQVSTDAYKATFKFSALQHISDEASADLAIDALLAYINANRASIKEGLKPLTANDLTVG